MGYRLYSPEYGINHMQEVGVEEGHRRYMRSGYLIEKGLDGVWGCAWYITVPTPLPHQSIIVPVLHDGHLPPVVPYI